ncbi:serine O-acetyltransferase [Psychrobacillus insolitus]|uniref:Serine acetyltransferase n=1 Tax=Psychrobacillus insolitus TaxID=1461 RepID=A0A2W7MJA6_9BACI|nr:DapH/DapD/GlmU-related protein [Psychrobacillus insolitus]PZX05949.1 serine O-acetyltransferase [Psychrobacillus insolitus]
MSAVMKCYRLSRKLYLRKVPFLPRITQTVMRILFSCDIPFTSDIHPSVKFGHNGLGVVVHPNSKIGEGSLIMQGVTLGGNRSKRGIYEGQEFACPIIGKNVFIGPGVKLLGPVIVGDNAQIGAGAVVTKDVPRNAISVGIPAETVKIIADHEVIKAE